MKIFTLQKHHGLFSLLFLTAFILILSGCPQPQQTEIDSPEEEHIHTWGTTEITNPTYFTEGRRKTTCTECGITLVSTTPALYSVPSDAQGHRLSSVNQGDTVYFGIFPRTAAPNNFTIDENTAEHISIGYLTYYKASDDNYYTKVTGTNNTTRWFRAEPIKWTVATTDYQHTSTSLLIADEILACNIPFYTYNVQNTTRYITVDGHKETINPNNYSYSQMRAFLNGLAYYTNGTSNETQLDYSYFSQTNHTGKGFLQTAFIPLAQNAIAGSGDKVFLLSESESTSSSLGFPKANCTRSDNPRRKVETDYAHYTRYGQLPPANRSAIPETHAWWTRSPVQNNGQGQAAGLTTKARVVSENGSIQSLDTNITTVGIVPAITIHLTGTSSIATISFVINTN